MDYTKILEETFDKNGKALVKNVDDKIIDDNKNNLKKIMVPGEWIYTKYKGELITFGQDEEELGKYFVTGKTPKSYKRFDDFNKAYDYWNKTYR